MAISLEEIKTQLLPKLSIFPSPNLELAIIVEHITKISRVAFITHTEKQISEKQKIKIYKMVSKRISGIASAYLIGYKEFYGRNFIVHPDVLIPRPETELLVDVVLSLIENISQINTNCTPKSLYRTLTNITNPQSLHIPQTILDCGTGTACIGLTLLKELRIRNIKSSWNICLSDISEFALSTARKNAQKILGNTIFMEEINSKSLNFVLSPLLQNITTSVGIIVANLPYIASNHLQLLRSKESSMAYEPTLALEGVSTKRQDLYDDGAALITLLFEEASNYTNSHMIVIEIDPLQCDRIMALASQYQYTHVSVKIDYRGKARIIHCIKYV